MDESSAEVEKASARRSRTSVSILHLTDIHAGAGELRDEDVKVSVPGAGGQRQLDRLAGYLEALPARPDFVVVSGDITIRGDRAGLESFRSWLENQIATGKLPDRSRIILTPGNHDVVRTDGAVQTNGAAHDERFRPFWEVFGTAFPHAHIPTFDPELELLPSLGGASEKHGIVGGLKLQKKGKAQKLVSSVPFLLDLETDVLIFAFNSAHGCGLPIPENKEIAEKLRALAVLSPHDKTKIDDIMRAYQASLVIDAGLIRDYQLTYFAAVMERLQEELGERYNQLTKLAFLHHHVTHLWDQQLELKTFEFTLDAAQLKRSLIENGFDFVLHGHKHTNHVSVDGSLIPISNRDPYSPLCIVSGGTVGGMPRLNDRQSFKLITLGEARGPRAHAVIQEVPLTDSKAYRRALARDSKTYHAPISRKLPQLHDLGPLKRALDRHLIRELAPEFSRRLDPHAEPVTVEAANASILDPSLGYRCYARFEHGDGSIYLDVLLLTRRLHFGSLARLHWLLSDVAALPSRSSVLLLLGNLERTHFFEGSKPEEVAESLKTLEKQFEPARKSGFLDLRIRTILPSEIDRLLEHVGQT